MTDMMVLVELRCASMEHGALSVMTTGITRMLVWSVDNWDTLLMVCGCNFHCILFHYNNFVGAISKTSFYSEYILPHTLFNISCTGNESSLFDCPYSTEVTDGSNCYSSEDAAVICQGCQKPNMGHSTILIY